jgi:hypothetical protein
MTGSCPMVIVGAGEELSHAAVPLKPLPHAA